MSGLASTMQTIALVFIAVHLLEAVVMIRHVRLYQGPLFVSILLTLLFGLLHWKPLAKAAAASEAGAGST